MVSDVRFDAETKLAEAPVVAKADLRLWLRLFTCTSLIEREIRRRLRKQFSETLPRFDLMAQLDRVEHGMTLGEVSKRMMVSAGNVTSLVERMVRAGYVERRTAPHDRRSQLIRLTRNGRHAFGVMAAAHQVWIGELLGELGERDMAAAMDELAKLKRSVTRALTRNGGRP
jgi:DNA-binding MarR family transcriptional regulator